MPPQQESSISQRLTAVAQAAPTTQSGEAEATEDPRVVEDHVDDVRDHHRDHDRREAVHRLEALPQRTERVERHDPDDGDAGVRRGHVGHRGRLAQHPEDGTGGEEQQRCQRAQQERQDQPAPHPARHGLGVLGAHRLGHDGVEHHQHAHPEDRRAEEIEVAQRDGADGLGRDAPHHHGVHRAHQHLAELHHHDRQRQADHRAELGTEAVGHAGEIVRGEHGDKVIRIARPAHGEVNLAHHHERESMT
jgi:hypothetical protein